MIRFSFVLLVLAFAGAAHATPATSCSRVEPTGERTLCHEAVIEAPVSGVWPLFATSDGVRSWMAPVAEIELRVGGNFETSHDASIALGDPRNIRNRVVAFVPERLLVIEVARPPEFFGHAEEVRQLTSVITFEPVSETRTRVRVEMLGYREGAAFDALYEFFDAGNLWTLNQLSARVANGPTDWSRAGAQ